MVDIASVNLQPRLNDTREQKISPMLRFELNEIKQHFEDDLEAICNQFKIYDQLVLESNKQCASLILNSQIVLLESAFDFYLHEVTKFGVTKIFENEWKKTEKYKNITMKLELVEKVIKGETDENWFFTFVNNNYSSATMVSYESIKDQLNLVGLKIKDIADKAFYENGSSQKTLDKMKSVVDGLYKRRNIIAHQSNRGHRDAEHYEISKDQVNEFINNIRKIVNAIHEEAISHE